ncbi:tautomerase family protein [bacterium]|nr:tautomerase family protein [bacterium]
MPLMKVKLSINLSDEKKKDLLASISKLVAECLGKPEKYVMVTIENTSIMISGGYGEGAYAELKSIGGLNSEVNRRISRKFCDLLEKSLGIPAEKVYINFIDVPASDWGWNGGIFG